MRRKRRRNSRRMMIGTAASKRPHIMAGEKKERLFISRPASLMLTERLHAIARMQVMAERVAEILIRPHQQVVDAATSACAAHLVEKLLHRFPVSIAESPRLGEDLFISFDVV